MGAIITSVLDANSLGPGLTLSQGGLVVTTTADALSKDRKVLATQDRALGDTGFECQFWSTTRPTILPTGNRVGLSTSDMPLNTCVGDDAFSIGYDLNTGNIVLNGATVATIDACQERRTITIMARFVGSHSILHFCVALDGSYQIDYDTGIGPAFWVPAVTVCGSTAADINAFLNFGKVAMNYPLIQGAA